MVTDLLAISGELKAAVNLVALIDRDVRLTRHGKRHVGLCPFHAEQARDELGETRP